jgi:hypothetical protein
MALNRLGKGLVMSENNMAEMQRYLVDIVKKIKRLKRKRGRINKKYVPYVKNRLMGYEALFGTESLRNLGRSHDYPGSIYRDDFFQDIKYRSKLRKIRDRLTFLENEYNNVLAQIKSNTNLEPSLTY